MLKLKGKKAQSAIEMLFIFILILMVVALLTPSYFEENKIISVVSYVRASASHACDYLNTGVFSDKYPYSTLNSVLMSLNGQNPRLRVVRLNLVQSDNELNISILISTPYSSINNETLAESIETFIEEELITKMNFVKINGTLFYDDTIVRINVRVER